MYSMGQSIPFKHWHSIGETLAALSYQSGSCARGEKTQDCSVHKTKRLNFESLEHKVAKLLLVFFGVDRRISHQ
jgi:hypothetical protein